MLKPKGMIFLTIAIISMTYSCSGPESAQPLLTAEIPLHLEEHISDAGIEGAEVSEDFLIPVEWNFSKPQPDWKSAGPMFTESGAVRLESTEDALRIHFSEEANRGMSGFIIGAVYVELPDWRREDWGDILVRAKSSESCLNLYLFYNLGEQIAPNSIVRPAVLYGGDMTQIISDGDIHTYKLRADVQQPEWGEWKDPWRQLILYFVATEPAHIDLLSVSIIPKEFDYADAPIG